MCLIIVTSQKSPANLIQNFIAEGYLTVSVLTFASVLFLALPVGIIGYEFTISWQKRGVAWIMIRFCGSCGNIQNSHAFTPCYIKIRLNSMSTVISWKKNVAMATTPKTKGTLSNLFFVESEEMFLKMRLRNSLSKWGYGIDDVEILFETWRKKNHHGNTFPHDMDV